MSVGTDIKELLAMQVHVTTDHEIVYWTLHHPEQGNSLGPSFVERCSERLDELEKHCLAWRQSPTTVKLAQRVLVVRASPAGQQRRIWIAGGNLKELAELPTKAEGRAYGSAMSEICRRLEALPIPTIMAIDGEAIGGGAEFALAGDLRLATQASCFDFKQLTVGLATGYGSTSRLIALLGRSRASQLLLLRERLSAEAALACNLVHRLVATRNDLMRLADQLATDFCRLDPLALACQKAMLYATDTHVAHEARQHELNLFGELWMNATHQKFLQSFS